MRRFNSKTMIALAAAAVLTLSLIIISFADGNTPGSEQDPIVTQSYVTQVADQLKTYIDGLISNIYQDITKVNTSLTANTETVSNLKTQLDAKTQELAQLNASVAALQEQLKSFTGATFEVVLVKKGSTVVTGQGTEIIIRSGKCVAIASSNGGLADTTDGKDLKSNEEIVLNHLLISSREDGRGFKASEDSYIIIKGGYTLK